MSLGSNRLSKGATSGIVQGFGCRPLVDRATFAVAGVRKPPRNEPAGYVRWKRRTLCYGDLVDAEGVSKRSQCAREQVIARLMGNRSCRGWWSHSLGVVVAGSL
jgi:hypothetical protein